MTCIGLDLHLQDLPLSPQHPLASKQIHDDLALL